MSYYHDDPTIWTGDTSWTYEIPGEPPRQIDPISDTTHHAIAEVERDLRDTGRWPMSGQTIVYALHRLAELRGQWMIEG